MSYPVEYVRRLIGYLIKDFSWSSLTGGFTGTTACTGNPHHLLNQLVRYMGGVSVTMADLATAARANPAMLTSQQTLDDFSMALSIRRDAIGAGTVTDLFSTAADVINPTKNIPNLEGIVAIEYR